MRSARTQRRIVLGTLAALAIGTLTGGVGVAQAAQSTTAVPHAASGRVLTVGTWHGVKGKYKTIQAAVDAAKTGDWVVIAPGDYKERADYHHKAPQGVGWPGAGVQVTTPGIPCSASTAMASSSMAPSPARHVVRPRRIRITAPPESAATASLCTTRLA